MYTCRFLQLEPGEDSLLRRWIFRRRCIQQGGWDLFPGSAHLERCHQAPPLHWDGLCRSGAAHRLLLRWAGGDTALRPAPRPLPARRRRPANYRQVPLRRRPLPRRRGHLRRPQLEVLLRRHRGLAGDTSEPAGGLHRPSRCHLVLLPPKHNQRHEDSDVHPKCSIRRHSDIAEPIPGQS